MPGFSVAQGSPRYQDTGQGPADRFASWSAWVADPSPLIGPVTTVILRTDTNDGVLALGRGGVGRWQPILDGYTNNDNAATYGDNCFYVDDREPVSTGLVYDGGVLILSPDVVNWPATAAGAPGSLWSNGGVVSVVPGGSYVVGSAPIYFGNITAAALLALGGNVLPPVTTLRAGSTQFGISPDGGEVWVA